MKDQPSPWVLCQSCGLPTTLVDASGDCPLCAVVEADLATLLHGGANQPALDIAVRDEIMERVSREAMEGIHDWTDERIAMQIRVAILWAIRHYHERMNSSKPSGAPGSEVLCEQCARVFCPHGEQLHFHHDGCPACANDVPEV